MNGPNPRFYFVVTGHGRSGTMYMARLISKFGYGVGHQMMGPDGISAFHAAHDCSILGDTFVDGHMCSERVGRPQYLIHVVRNPWKVVESDYRVDGPPSQTISRWDSRVRAESGLKRSILSVVLWNRRVRDLRPHRVFRVEDCPGVVIDFMRETGHKIGVSGLKLETNINHAPRELNGPPDYSTMDEATMDMLRAHCRYYGYSDKEWP